MSDDDHPSRWSLHFQCRKAISAQLPVALAEQIGALQHQRQLQRIKPEECVHLAQGIRLELQAKGFEIVKRRKN